MNKEKALEIFLELLEEWYGSERCVIEEHSGAIDEELHELKVKKVEYECRFKETLK